MSLTTIGIIGLIVLIILLFSKMPVGFVMAFLGFLGFSYIVTINAGLSLLAKDVFETFSSYSNCYPIICIYGANCLPFWNKQKIV